MNQELKNKYISLVSDLNADTILLISEVFDKIDELLLKNRGTNTEQRLFAIIESLKGESLLYEELSKDIRKRVLRNERLK